MTEKFDLPLEQVRYAYAASIVYPPGGKFGPRVQNDLQLVMLYTGEMNVTIDGRSLHARPGSVVLLKPGHEESFAFSKTEQSWHRWIAVTVSPEAYDDRNRRALQALPEVLPLSEEMNRLTDLMIMLLQRLSPADAAVRSLGVSALQLYPAESVRMLQQREKHPGVYRALEHIRQHYAEQLTLAQLAAQAGLSSEHLVRLFRQSERTTPIDYLWKYRVGQAVELLINTGLNVSEVAERCGFQTSHHLARLIKQRTGRTASEVRRLSWDGQTENEPGTT